jgi:hypothetical protein
MQVFGRRGNTTAAEPRNHIDRQRAVRKEPVSEAW